MQHFSYKRTKLSFLEIWIKKACSTNYHGTEVSFSVKNYVGITDNTPYGRLSSNKKIDTRQELARPCNCETGAYGCILDAYDMGICERCIFFYSALRST